ncbi:hypothetical protein E4U43_007199 [Claviceps pusilla]|uniref:ER membrane protein complex subunit 4 n=1 Tax=Claviceps pusilla TaxID=123648 RepID=A0A9P7NCZ7_9HYPO|nr:hypothetical protein E4U43_007199 [Claviceps pusilla]
MLQGRKIVVGSVDSSIRRLVGRDDFGMDRLPRFVCMRNDEAEQWKGAAVAKTSINARPDGATNSNPAIDKQSTTCTVQTPDRPSYRKHQPYHQQDSRHDTHSNALNISKHDQRIANNLFSPFHLIMATPTTHVPTWVAQLRSPPPAKSKVPGIPDPVGFSPSSPSGSKKPSKDSKVQPRKPPSADEMETLKVKKAWEIALAPVKALPMTGIMMYMSGNSLQIFSIMMVFMAFKNPIVGLMATNQAFEKFHSEKNAAQILQIKLVYVVMQLIALAVGIWKVNSMGLLPTTRSDWLMWESLRESVDKSIPAL